MSERDILEEPLSPEEEQETEKARARDKIVMQGLMSMQDFRSLLYDWLYSSGVFNDTFSGEPYVNAYNDGRRSLGIEMQNRVKSLALPEFLKMIEENSDENI